MKKMNRISMLSMSMVFAFVISSTLISTTHALSSDGLSLSDVGKASCAGTYGGGKLSEDKLDQICRTYLHSLGSDYNGLKDTNSFSSNPLMIILAALVGAGVGVVLATFLMSNGKRRSKFKIEKNRHSAKRIF